RFSLRDANSRRSPPGGSRRTSVRLAGRAQRCFGLFGLTKTVGSSWRIALALSQTRCGLPFTQIVRFCRFGFTACLCTPTCFRPTPPLRFAEPLRVLVCCYLVFLPVTAHTRGMSLLRARPGASPARIRLAFAAWMGAGRPQSVTGYHAGPPERQRRRPDPRAEPPEGRHRSDAEPPSAATPRGVRMAPAGRWDAGTHAGSLWVGAARLG